MQRNTGYSVECCNADDRAALASKLFELSQLTWVQIRQAGRHQMGTEKIELSAIKAPLPKVVTEDTTILAIRFNGKAHMLGKRDGRVFYILLLDWTFHTNHHG